MSSLLPVGSSNVPLCLLFFLLSIPINSPVSAFLTPSIPAKHIFQASLRRALSSTSEEAAETASCFPNAIPVSDHDRSVLQRQTGQIAPSVAALGVPAICQCQHGYPQVFLLNPLVGGERMNSGLLKLSCPLLVNAIDAMEDDGYIANFTSKVQANEFWKESVQESHKKHADARQAILTAKSTSSDNVNDSLNLLKQKLGDRGANAFLNSGIAGSTVDKPDVKCLHAWMGDYLFHTASNKNIDVDGDQHEHLLGAAIASTLAQERQVSLCGTPDCHRYCNPQAVSVEGPPKARNKQRLKTRKEKDRRKRKKERDQAATTAAAGDA